MHHVGSVQHTLYINTTYNGCCKANCLVYILYLNFSNYWKRIVNSVHPFLLGNPLSCLSFVFGKLPGYYLFCGIPRPDYLIYIYFKFFIDRYKGRSIIKNNNTVLYFLTLQVVQKIMEAHSNVQNLNLVESKMAYIKAWQALPDFGINYFVMKQKNSKKEVSFKHYL